MNVVPVRRSPVARMHAALGATLEVEDDWELVATYGDEERERSYVADAVAVADITPRAKIDVRGSIEGALRSAGDGLVARIGDGWALVVGEPGAEARLLPEMEASAGVGAMVTDATHLYAGFLLSGARLPDLLARLSGWDPATLAPGAATGAPIAEIRSVIVRRDPNTVEAYVATEFARYAWESIASVADRLGGGPVGWRVLREGGWR